MPERRVTVAIPEGLHARSAALFVRLVSEQPAAVTIRKDGGDPVSAGSILAVMTLGACAGDDVVLTADGDGAEASLDVLERFISVPQH